MNILELMAAPFAECLVLVAIHTYLGIHVLKRRVVFVDLALAQIAALGTTVGFLFGIMPETPGSLLFSMAFTFLGAAVFSVTRFRREKVPQEAIIGLTYAIASAVAILVVEKTRGAEELKDILVGNLLWVKWSDVLAAAAVYLLIGCLHVLFRKKLMLISENPEKAFADGISVHAWDFFFYMTFGIVITFSTRVAGVLLVFVFLVAPAILALILTNQTWLQLLIGWSTGTVVTIVGLFLSWKLDLPSGPAVIAFYGVALVLGGVSVYYWRAENRLKAARSILMGGAVALAVGLGLWQMGRALGHSSISVSEEAEKVEANVSRERIAVMAEEKREREAKRKLLASRTSGCAAPDAIDRYLSLAGPEERLAEVRVRLAEDNRDGMEFLALAMADDELPLLYRQEVEEALRGLENDTFGYDPQRDVSGNLQAIEHLCERIGALPPK